MNRIYALAAMSLLGATALAGCSSDDSSSASSAEPSKVGASSVCDDATITSAIQQSLDAEGAGAKVFSLGDLTCADGWAVAMPTLGADEATAITETSVLQAEGQFWLVKDRMVVCGTTDAADPEAYPADAEVPESLYAEGCLTN